MIQVKFEAGTYIVKDEEKTLNYKNNLYDALIDASNKSKNEGFMVMCNVPDNDNKPKHTYRCPKCDNNMDIHGSIKSGHEDIAKDEYLYCVYCNLRYLIMWIEEPFKP